MTTVTEPPTPPQDDAPLESFELFPAREVIGTRLDRYVAGELTHLSRTYLQSLIDGGNVLVDGVPRRAAFKITPGQRVDVTIPETVEFDALPEDLPLDVIYHDADVVVVNKVAGMVVHPAPGHPIGTLVNAVLHHFPEISIGGTHRPGIVHRLDKDTSGVMIVAKTDAAQNSLIAQWQARTVDKQYRTLVAGVIEEDEATINAPIGRDPANRLRMAAVRSGKDAISHFTVRERLENMTSLNVKIDTGRTHQIRVHLAMIGHPVVADHLYATPKSGTISHETGLQRQFLHASHLKLTLPSGEVRTFTAPLPQDLSDTLERLGASK